MFLKCYVIIRTGNVDGSCLTFGLVVFARNIYDFQESCVIYFCKHREDKQHCCRYPNLVKKTSIVCVFHEALVSMYMLIEEEIEEEKLTDVTIAIE